MAMGEACGAIWFFIVVEKVGHFLENSSRVVIHDGNGYMQELGLVYAYLFCR